MTWNYCIQGRILSFDLPACHTLWPGHQSLSRVRYDMLRGLAEADTSLVEATIKTSSKPQTAHFKSLSTQGRPVAIPRG